MHPGPGDFWETLPLGPGVRLLARDDRGLAAFDKPAGILSHPNASQDGPRSLLGVRYDKEAQAYAWTAGGTARRLWLLNRLDSATSGVILAAADAALADAVREHFRRQHVNKVYQALVFGRPARPAEVWRDRLAVHREEGRIRTSTTGHVPAETAFRLERHGQAAFSTALVRLEPRTGRSHQLRVQCAKRGLPIVGDQTYGDFALNRAFARATGQRRMFLHSLETRFTYELGGRRHAFQATAPLPPEFAATY